MNPIKNIIDISQGVTPDTACFPGDTPFSAETVLTVKDTQCLNLSRFTSSPHVGTHADAYVHVQGEMHENNGIGNAPLDPYIGPCQVLDFSDYRHEITTEMVEKKLETKNTPCPSRLLFKTQSLLRATVFEEDYAYFSPELISFLHCKGVRLIGIDTPSVDHTDSKMLATHHQLVDHQMAWLENLDLTEAKEHTYFLSAAPVKYLTLEAAPVRAVLIEF